MPQHRSRRAVQVAVVRLGFGKLVRVWGAVRQITRPVADENLPHATNPKARDERFVHSSGKRAGLPRHPKHPRRRLLGRAHARARWRTSRSPASRVGAVPELVRALAFVKKAAARANAKLGVLDAQRADAIAARLRRPDRRRAARPVRRRRDPGRRRHLDQHERQRGDRQPRARAPGSRRAASYAAPAPERPRQRLAEHQRRLPDGAAPGGLGRHRRAARARWPSCAAPSRPRRPSSAAC